MVVLNFLKDFIPASVSALKGYDRKRFTADVIAGITVGLVALPLAMAFAISSGVKPENGIYCAIVAGFLISALGGSRTQIGGPTGAFVVVIFNIVQRHGLDGLFMCTLMAGVMLLVMGLTGLGSTIRFIPRPVVVGFTNGIAVLIASTQIKDFFGIDVDKVPGDFIGRIETLALHAMSFSAEDTAVGVGALVLILFCTRYLKRVPGYIVAMVVGIALVELFHLNVETIGSRFGGIPSGLPHILIPTFRFDLIRPLVSPAITIAMLGAIESLLSATVADRMSGDKHNPNMELVAQGVANIVSPMFGGLPATGAIARTATNIRSGATTPVSGMVHALTLLVVLIVAAPMAKAIPLSVLAAILFVVSYNMGEWSQIPELLKLSKSDIIVWLLTFLLTVFTDLTTAVEFGMTLAALLFIRKVTITTTVSEVTPEYIEGGRVHILQDKHIPPYVIIFRIHGPFLFGATEKIADITTRIQACMRAAKSDAAVDPSQLLPPIVILRLRNTTAIDATGLHALENLAVQLRDSGRAMILCGAPTQPSELMHQAEFEQHVGKENICFSVADALKRAKEVLPEVEKTAIGSSWVREECGRI